MRVLADENMTDGVVALLREAGHNVLWVKEEQPRTPDPDVLEWATRESRLLITFDKDFGELSQRDHRPAPFGVILFRISDDLTVDETDQMIVHNVSSPVEWPSYLWVVAIRKRLAIGQPDTT